MYTLLSYDSLIAFVPDCQRLREMLYTWSLDSTHVLCKHNDGSEVGNLTGN